MLAELRKENQLRQLQRKYEDGEIQEEELTKEQKEELLLLYKQEIANLEAQITDCQETLKGYKAKILEKRKKV